MKQLGNLPIVCANRPGVLMQVYGGQVTVHVGSGPDRAVLHTEWNNDAEFHQIIQELNFGKYRGEKNGSCRVTNFSKSEISCNFKIKRC